MFGKDKYKVIPCIHSKTAKKGWKIVENKDIEWDYVLADGSVIVYYNYQKALDDCEHLNGRGKVFGYITQDSWDVLKCLLAEWRMEK